MDNQLVDQLYNRAVQMHVAREQLKAWGTDVNNPTSRKTMKQLQKNVKKAERNTQKAIQSILDSQGIGFYEENATSRQVKDLIANLLERAQKDAVEKKFWQIVNVSVI